MPTYDFRCPHGHEFTKFFRKISDGAAELPCPNCGAVAQRQLSAGAGLHFKGSGFYLTDYGKNAHRKAAPSGGSKSDGKGAPAGASKGGESKPAGESSGGSSGAAPAGGSGGGGSTGGGGGAAA